MLKHKHTSINRLRISFILFFRLHRLVPKKKKKFSKEIFFALLITILGMTTDDVSEERREEEEIIQHQETLIDLTRYTLYFVYYLCTVCVCGWWIPTQFWISIFLWFIFILFFQRSIHSFILIVNDMCVMLMCIENDWIMPESLVCDLPSKWSRLFPRIWSLMRFEPLGTLSACRIPTDVWSKCPGPDLGTCELQYTCKNEWERENKSLFCDKNYNTRLIAQFGHE